MSAQLTALVDWLLQQRITSHLNVLYVYQVPILRLTYHDPEFRPIVERSAHLVCTAPEFGELANEVGVPPSPLVPLTARKGSQNGATDSAESARLRAELDGLIAHLYGLTEADFAHVLSTFPLVAEPVKVAALNAYRDLEWGLIS